jgi:hypothetical protein
MKPATAHDVIGQGRAQFTRRLDSRYGGFMRRRAKTPPSLDMILKDI